MHELYFKTSLILLLLRKKLSLTTHTEITTICETSLSYMELLIGQLPYITPLTSWVERHPIYLPMCGTKVGGVFHPASQATGKVFSTEHAIYSKIYLELVSVGKL